MAVVGDAPVLIGFAEAMAGIEASWSIRGTGREVVAFSRRGARPALRYSPGVEVHQVTPPEIDVAATIGEISDLATRLGVGLVLPLDDSALWVGSRAHFADAVFAGPTGPAAEAMFDKALQLQLAAAAGFLVPPTQVVESFDQVSPDEWPVVVKPALVLTEHHGRLLRPGGLVLNGKEEHAEAKRVAGRVLVQPLLRGRGEGLFGHRSRSGLHALSAHRRVRMVNPQGSASSACESIPVEPDLAISAETFLEGLSWRGLFMFEFLKDSAGRSWFMEINGRTWGSLALSRRRGYEYASWTVEAALDESYLPKEPDAPPQILCRNVGLELAHLAYVVRGPQSAALTDWPKTGRTVRDIFTISKNDRLYNFDRHDYRMLMADTFMTLLDLGRKFRASRT